MNPIRRRSVTAVALFILANTAAVSLRAQGGEEAKGLVGMSISWATDDAQRPERFNYEPARTVRSLHGSVFLHPRVAVGSEWTHLGTIEAPGGSPRAQILEKHREHALFGTLRARLAGRGRSAFDAVGGIGALFQRRETTSVAGGTTSTSNTSAAFIIRAEGQVALSRHVAVTPTAGLYSLRRPDATTSLLNLSRTSSSTRGLVGVGVSALW
jgi:hypothetical protein